MHASTGMNSQACLSTRTCVHTQKHTHTHTDIQCAHTPLRAHHAGGPLGDIHAGPSEHEGIQLVLSDCQGVLDVREPQVVHIMVGLGTVQCQRTNVPGQCLGTVQCQRGHSTVPAWAQYSTAWAQRGHGTVPAYKFDIVTTITHARVHTHTVCRVRVCLSACDT